MTQGLELSSTNFRLLQFIQVYDAPEFLLESNKKVFLIALI